MDADGLVALTHKRLERELPDYRPVAQPELESALRAGSFANVFAACASLCGPGEPAALLPPDAEEEARAAARTGLPLTTLLHSYRIGHAVLWEAFLETIGRLPLEGETRWDALRVGGAILFAYHDAAAFAIAAAYRQERDRWLGRPCTATRTPIGT